MTKPATLLKYILLGLLINLISCSFDKPSAPSWDVDVTVPLISKVYTMAELADDETALSIDSTGLLNLRVEAELDKYEVGDQLTLDDVDEEMTFEIGIFTVESPGSEFTNVELREIFAQADTLDGQTVVVDSFSFVSDKKVLDPYDNFSYVVVSTGSLNLSVTNNLPVPLGSPLTIGIWDANSDTLVVSDTNNTQILPGQTRSFIMDLQGKKLPNALAVRMSGDSPGSGGQSVTIDAGSRFEIEAAIGEIEVTEAMAQIPAQVITSEESAAITDSVVIVEASVENGAINMSLSGNVPLDAWITCEIPDIKSASGDVLVDSFFVAKYSEADISIDLRGRFLRPQMADFGKQEIRVNWSARTVDTGTEMVLVKSSDTFGANFGLRGMSFSAITGKIADTSIEIDQSEIDLDIPADLDSIFFEFPEMELQINNGINFPLRAILRIEGENKAGAIVEMLVDEIIQPATAPGVPVTTTIVLNNLNSAINEFISILPNKIRVFGEVKLGNESWIGTVSQDDYMDGLVTITAPLVLTLPAQMIESDPLEIDIPEDVRNEILDNLASGSFFVQLGNHLPVGASVEFLFSKNEMGIFTNPILQVGPVRADAGVIDAAGLVGEVVISESTLGLTEEQMRTFLQTPLFAGLRITVDGTNGQLVKVRGTDFIDVKSFSKIQVKINQDD